MAHGRVMFGVGPAASNAWAYKWRDRLMARRTQAIEHAGKDSAGRHG